MGSRILSFPDIARVQPHRLIDTFSYPTASPSPLSKQLTTSSSSSGCARVHWNSAGAANCGGGGLVLSGEAAGDAGLNATQVYYVTAYSAAEPRTLHCECMRKTPGAGSEYAYKVSVQA